MPARSRVMLGMAVPTIVVSRALMRTPKLRPTIVTAIFPELRSARVSMFHPFWRAPPGSLLKEAEASL